MNWIFKLFITLVFTALYIYIYGVKLVGFQSHLEASHSSSHTEEL